MNASKICVVLVVVFVILLSGCGESSQVQPTIIVVKPSNTSVPTNTSIPTSTNIPTSTSTPIPTKTIVPTNTTIPTETFTPTPEPRMWTYEQRQLFWSQSGAAVILYEYNPTPDQLIPYDKSSTTPEELWSWEIPADYLCQWLYDQIISGVAFPEFEDREFVWQSSAHWLGYADKEPYCLQFDLEVGFNP